MHAYDIRDSTRDSILMKNVSKWVLEYLISVLSFISNKEEDNIEHMLLSCTVYLNCYHEEYQDTYS